jgi:anti-sigma B factor antagonist
VSIGEVRIARVDGVTIASLRGEIDISNAATVGGEIMDAVEVTARGAVIDLTETIYLDSAGVRTLFELAHRLQQRSQEMRLIARNEAIVRRVIALTRLDDRVPLHDTVDEAVAAMTDGA